MGKEDRAIDHANIPAHILDGRQGVQPVIVLFAPYATGAHGATAVMDQLRACAPEPQLQVAKTATDLAGYAGTAQHIVILFEKAADALIRAALQGAPFSSALTTWIAQTKTVSEFCKQVSGKVTLLSSADPVLRTDQIQTLGLTPPADGGFGETWAAPQFAADPILTSGAAATLANSAEARALSAELEALQDAAAADTPGADPDALLGQYIALQSELEEMRAEMDGLAQQLAQAQGDLSRYQRAIQTVDIPPHLRDQLLEVAAQGGDRRRRQPLRRALAHQQVISDLGPLTPRMISAPFLTRQLETVLGVTSADDDLAAHAGLVELTPKETMDLAPRLTMNEQADFTSGAIRIHPGAAGHQFYGPYLKLAPGRYQIEARLSVPQMSKLLNFDRQRVAVLEVVSSASDKPKYKSIFAGTFNKAHQRLSVPFDIRRPRDGAPPNALEVRLWSNGKMPMTFTKIELRRLG